MEQENQSMYFELQGRTYEVVRQLAVEDELSLGSALDLLVAKGVKMVNFERVGDESSKKSLDSLTTKLDVVHEQIDRVIEALKVARL